MTDNTDITGHMSMGSPESGLSSVGPTHQELEHEKRFWYFGLYDDPYISPRLIARSSTYQFPYRHHSFAKWLPPNEEEPEPKKIFPVVRHDIINGYDRAARMVVRDSLRDIPWSSINVVRIGYGKSALENPVVVLINADITQTGSKDAQKAVDNIRNIMLKNHWDVHAEIKEGHLNTSAGGNSPKQMPNIGASVGSRETTHTRGKSGTLSAFIKLDHQILALTCQHCVKSDNDKAIASEIIVDQPSMSDLKTAIKDAKTDIAHLQTACAEYDEEEQTRLAVNHPWSAGARQKVEADRKLLRDFMIDLQALETFNPSFGTVARVSGISQDAQSGFIRDWALIKLDKNRFTKTKPQNLPPIFDISVKESRAIVSGGYVVNISLGHEEVNSIVPLTEIAQALENPGPEDRLDMRSMRVIKHGRSSGWTGGSLNQIRSDCRRGALVTTELCVVNLPSAKAFSLPGDSGALVLDTDGRVVGMMHSGNDVAQIPMEHLNELTYVTPMEWLLKDIKSDTGVHSVSLQLY